METPCRNYGVTTVSSPRWSSDESTNCPFEVYYNGDNVSTPDNICPPATDPHCRVSVLWVCTPRDSPDPRSDRFTSGFSMTLFQSLATSAGYDPVQGPGSSCTAAGSSGQCVLPWGGGTKSVNSIVLVATGVSFAVRPTTVLL